MNLANKLTIARICMIPFFILFMELDGVYNSILALIIFCVASITDLLDGQIARKNKTITSLGIFLDPLADKLLMSAAFICFVGIPMLGIPAWMVIVIISREFLITGFRSVAAVKNVMIPADKAGKFKTTFQIVVIIITMVILIVNEILSKFTDITPEILKLYNYDSYAILIVIMEKTPFWATLVATVLTIYSGANYIFKYRKLLSEK
ncbi:MAG: CDP-diacylglycerol--glycerol-3-phosphate 3-phosphatidyltransferase [Endomicrobium sp.]|nr:CDP-diacylglycerol--glycerol-3-phosphate 3-phosphatidyltransferase [Endomicrobium sp.]